MLRSELVSPSSRMSHLFRHPVHRHCAFGTAVAGLMSHRYGGLASKSYYREVADMKDSEILSLMVGIIGLVLSAIIVGATIG